jgi:hypothetical protein
MKRVLRYQSHLLYRKRRRGTGRLSVRPRLRAFAFRPKRDGPPKPASRCVFGIAW